MKSTNLASAVAAPRRAPGISCFPLYYSCIWFSSILQLYNVQYKRWRSFLWDAQRYSVTSERTKRAQSQSSIPPWHHTERPPKADTSITKWTQTGFFHCSHCRIFLSYLIEANVICCCRGEETHGWKDKRRTNEKTPWHQWWWWWWWRHGSKERALRSLIWWRHVLPIWVEVMEH